MSAREAILGRLKAKLAGAASGTATDTDRAAAVAARLANPPTGIIPARGQLPDDARIALFVTMAEKAAASCVRLGRIEDLPAEIARYLKAKNLPATIRMGSDPLLARAGWDSQRQIEVKTGATDGHDLTGLSHAAAAIAESGTLMLASGPDNPTTLNFLPEHHIVVLAAADIHGDLEGALARLRQSHGKGLMPRVANLVTGPSRSGDIEQTIILGAHGPRALHIVIIDGK